MDLCVEAGVGFSFYVSKCRCLKEGLVSVFPTEVLFAIWDAPGCPTWPLTAHPVRHMSPVSATRALSRCLRCPRAVQIALGNYI